MTFLFLPEYRPDDSYNIRISDKRRVSESPCCIRDSSSAESVFCGRERAANQCGRYCVFFLEQPLFFRGQRAAKFFNYPKISG
jgi:hypothetical protein